MSRGSENPMKRKRVGGTREKGNEARAAWSICTKTTLCAYALASLWCRPGIYSSYMYPNRCTQTYNGSLRSQNRIIVLCLALTLNIQTTIRCAHDHTDLMAKVARCSGEGIIHQPYATIEFRSQMRERWHARKKSRASVPAPRAASPVSHSQLRQHITRELYGAYQN